MTPKHYRLKQPNYKKIYYKRPIGNKKKKEPNQEF